VDFKGLTAISNNKAEHYPIAPQLHRNDAIKPAQCKPCLPRLFLPNFFLPNFFLTYSKRMKSIVVLGTSSSAGKSTITMALCRLLYRQGKRVSPFKAVSISGDLYRTENGKLISYVQALQAWAAGANPSLNTAPILLSCPDASTDVEAWIAGESVGRMDLIDVYEQHQAPMWEVIQNCLDRLQHQFDVLVCEGLGSPVEIGLGISELANLKVARYLDAEIVLVVDGGRGGALAHLVGTIEMMAEADRKRICGIIINRFLGSRRVLQEGITWLRDQVKVPHIMVVPELSDQFKSQAVKPLNITRYAPVKRISDIRISVILLPHTRGFADFDPLEAEPNVSVKYVQPDQPLGYPDAVILPGTRKTIADLLTLRETGLAAEIQEYVSSGGTVLGILGGYHLLGETIADPEGVEGTEGRYDGIGILPIKSVIRDKQIGRQRSVMSQYPQAGLQVTGYEKHQARIQATQPDTIRLLFDEPSIGLVDQTDSVWGVNLHGIFDHGPWRRIWINRLRQQRGLKALPTGISNYRDQREACLNDLADEVAAHLNLEMLLSKD